jgi:LPXTG-site transpeptidase (sortase) family protein
MQSEPSRFKKVRYYSSVAGLYLLMLLFAYCVFRPAILPSRPVVALASPAPKPIAPEVKIVSGKPIRILIPDLNIDLPVDEGNYDPTDNSWTLSGYHAQFATPSMPANDHDGNTFIYGHNNKYVFGSLKHIIPGTVAKIYTDNDHIFSYIFESTVTVVPEDVSILNYKGPSIMTIQTCSGAWNEQRQMFKFNFDKADQ